MKTVKFFLSNDYSCLNHKAYETVDILIDHSGEYVPAADVRALVEAAKNFVESIELVHNDPEYQAVWQLYQAHIPTGYRGRKYTELLDKLKSALERIGEVEG